MALANPEPEIRPELAHQVRPDAILCTGRSDYPNQVNNVLCFPFIFRGALDVSATVINDAMKIAAVHAIAELARAEASDIVASAYGGQAPQFGPDYLIPKPFDPRLIERIAPAVAKAAMDSGVATRPLDDLEAYRQRMARFAYHSGTSMKPVFQAAKAAPKRVLYAEGEEERVLRAVQVVVDEGIAFPVLLGRADVIARRIETLGLRLRVGETCEVVNILSDPRYPSVVAEYYELGRRGGVTQAIAKEAMRSRASLIAAMLLRRGDVDAMLCGTVGTFDEHLRHVREVIGCRKGVLTLAAMNMLMLPDRQIFICDTYVNRHPKAVEIAEMTLLAAEEIRRFGLTPVGGAAFAFELRELGSAGGAADARCAHHPARARPRSGRRGRDARRRRAVEGCSRPHVSPLPPCVTEANLLMMPSVDAANIAYNLLKVAAGNGITVGPILLGLAKPAHILEPGVTVRRIVNMTALATVDAGVQR